MENIIAVARRRYTAKHYNPAKKLNPAQIAAIKELLRLAPSSVNSQPWHFIIAASAAGKARLAKATAGFYSFNTGKIMDSGLTIIFCAKTQIDNAYLQHITDQEREDGRYGGNKEIEKANQQGRIYFTDLHRKERHDLPCWTARQTYLNIGAFLLGAAAMGLDATPIEGFDPAILNEEFGLAERGLEGLCLVSVGHRADDDANATRPKSRLAEAEIMEEI